MAADAASQAVQASRHTLANRLIEPVTKRLMPTSAQAVKRQGDDRHLQFTGIFRGRCRAALSLLETEDDIVGRLALRRQSGGVNGATKTVGHRHA
jgi:hypothetical protein